MSKDDFFNNAIKTECEHDLMHTFLTPEPVYKKILKDGCDVEVCEEKFLNLTHEEKVLLTFDEVALMSAERYKGLDYRVRYEKMLKKFIINHANIWQSIWIIENYVELHKPLYNFMQKLNQELIKNNYKELV